MNPVPSAGSLRYLEIHMKLSAQSTVLQTCAVLVTEKNISKKRNISSSRKVIGALRWKFRLDGGTSSLSLAIAHCLQNRLLVSFFEDDIFPFLLRFRLFFWDIFYKSTPWIPKTYPHSFRIRPAIRLDIRKELKISVARDKVGVVTDT